MEEEKDEDEKEDSNGRSQERVSGHHLLTLESTRKVHWALGEAVSFFRVTEHSLPIPASPGLCGGHTAEVTHTLPECPRLLVFNC